MGNLWLLGTALLSQLWNQIEHHHTHFLFHNQRWWKNPISQSHDINDGTVAPSTVEKGNCLERAAHNVWYCCFTEKSYKHAADLPLWQLGTSWCTVWELWFQLGNVLTLPAPWFPRLRHGDNAIELMGWSWSFNEVFVKHPHNRAWHVY